MSKVESLFGQFKTNEERNQFMEAQLQTITNLTKTVEEQKSKIKHLESLLKEATKPLILNEAQQTISNEELIVKEQIRLLKNTSDERELTLEESRKLDTYVKIYLSLNGQDKSLKSSVSNLDTKALLKLVEEPS